MNEQNTLYGENVEQNILQNDLIKVYTYSIKRTLVCIGFIDFFIQLLNGFSIIQTNDKSILPYGYVCFGCAALILIGIYGINRYYKYISFGYGIYLFLQIITRCILLYFYRIDAFFLIFTLALIFINIWILKLLCRFVNNLKNLPESDLQELKNGWHPTFIYQPIYY